MSSSFDGIDGTSTFAAFASETAVSSAGISDGSSSLSSVADSSSPSEMAASRSASCEEIRSVCVVKSAFACFISSESAHPKSKTDIKVKTTAMDRAASIFLFIFDSFPSDEAR